jgi:hypothetical protein
MCGSACFTQVGSLGRNAIIAEFELSVTRTSFQSEALQDLDQGHEDPEEQTEREEVELAMGDANGRKQEEDGSKQ